jgi:hypothetical protein
MAGHVLRFLSVGDGSLPLPVVEHGRDDVVIPNAIAGWAWFGTDTSRSDPREMDSIMSESWSGKVFGSAWVLRFMSDGALMGSSRRAFKGIRIHPWQTFRVRMVIRNQTFMGDA